MRDDERCGRSKEVNAPELIGQRFRVTMLWFLGSSERDSVGRDQHSSKSTTPSLSQTIWPRWASRKFLSLPNVHTLLPMTFGYSLISRKNLKAVVMRQLRRSKRLWRRSLTRSRKRTSMGPCRSYWNGATRALQLEEITSKRTRSFMCVLSIKVPLGKKGLGTYRMLLVCWFLSFLFWGYRIHRLFLCKLNQIILF